MTTHENPELPAIDYVQPYMPECVERVSEWYPFDLDELLVELRKANPEVEPVKNIQLCPCCSEPGIRRVNPLVADWDKLVSKHDNREQ